MSTYTTINFKTKRALRDALARGVEVRLFQTGLGEDPPENGITWIEGPHYPKPHTWYAEVTVKDGLVVKVK